MVCSLSLNMLNNDFSTPPGPHHHTERVSNTVFGAGGGRSNKER